MIPITRKAAKKSVREWAKNKYQNKITVTFNKEHPASFNQSCHMNSSHFVESGEAVLIAEVVIINDECCTLHYINMDASGNYFDATLGFEYKDCDYRLIRLMRGFDGYPGDTLSKVKDEIALAALGRFGVKLHKGEDLL